MTAPVVEHFTRQPRDLAQTSTLEGLADADLTAATTAHAGTRDDGSLWQRLGSPTGPVRGVRRFAVGAVVDTFEGRKIRAIETETRDEFCISRVRRPHEIAEGVYPHAATYAMYRHPDA